MKKKLLERIENDRDELIAFLRKFVQAKSPNPPGDTRDAAAVVAGFLENKGIKPQIIAPKEQWPNLMAHFKGRIGHRTLVLNGHMDVFPVKDPSEWTHDPWGAVVDNGRMYGRGVCDMKCGTAASVIAYTYLHDLQKELAGNLTVTAVSDEETFGPWGAKYLVDNFEEARGHCCLNGEPSSPFTLRFGERGLLWLAFTIRTPGAHGAYPHLSASASKIAIKLAAELQSLEKLPVPAPEDVTRVLSAAGDAIDRALGKGGSEVIKKVNVNIGTIQGGVKVNVIPSECRLEADLRLPVGMTREPIIENVDAILDHYPEATVEEIAFSPPNWSDPSGEMATFLMDNVENLRGFRPDPIVSLGGSDLRHWRHLGIPAYYYGPMNHGMGTTDEYVEIEEFLHIVRTHTLCAYDWLMQ